MDPPAFNWKLWVAMGVPFNNNVQLPGDGMFEPVLVMVKVPKASGVQEALKDRVGAVVGVRVGVAVGDWQKVETVAGEAPPPLVSSSNVPNSPEVLTEVDAPASSWKLLVAMGVPFNSSV